MSKKVTTSSFINKARLLHGDKYDYSETEYLKSDEKVEIKCEHHGIFLQTPSNHYKYGCKKCADTKTGLRRRLDKNILLENLKLRHGCLYNYPDFENLCKTTKSKIPIECNKHGIFYQKYENHQNGQGCPYCRRTSKDDGKTTLYLCEIETSEGVAVKVGVTKHVNPMKRLKHLSTVKKILILKERMCSRKAVELEKVIIDKFCEGFEFHHDQIKTEIFSIEDLPAVVKFINENK